MSTRTDSIALRSLLALCAVLALVLSLRFYNFDFVKRTLSRLEEDAQMITNAMPKPSPVPQGQDRPINPTTFERVQPIVREREMVVVTPIAIAPQRVARLRVEPSKWSAPLHVPAGESVGIKFSLGRIRIERNGIIAGTLCRNPSVITNGSRITLRPLASLDRTPRVFWFEKEARVLRFISLENRQSEEVEVLWNK